ncbi:hypothetical protein [Pseudomonas sp. USHLN015]|uniref:hypothetical protein n=1 Tax=Pseudomonas sp. USHLN015 TaxID=3081296 RepID=UPI00301BCD8C
MTGLSESAVQRRINAQACTHPLAHSIALLKRANRYVGTHSSIGAMELSVLITEFIADYERQEKKS